MNVSENGSEDGLTQEGEFTAFVEQFKSSRVAQLEERVT